MPEIFDGNAPISIKKETINAEKVNLIQTTLRTG